MEIAPVSLSLHYLVWGVIGPLPEKRGAVAQHPTFREISSPRPYCYSPTSNGTFPGHKLDDIGINWQPLAYPRSVLKLQAILSKRTTAHGPSFLRWAGSKRKSLSKLATAYVDRNCHYIEPFAGSAALFFSLRPHSGTLADLNGHLINTLCQVRDFPDKVHEKVMSLQRTPETYYEIRSEFNRVTPFGLESAAYFVYLNRNCFNGLWRTNKSGYFNVPYGGTEMGGTPPLSLFKKCSEALQRANLCEQDFRKTIDEAEDGSFIYADPPYFTTAERTFIEYGKKSFGKSDLDDLVLSLCEADKRGVRVVLTYNEAMPIEGIPAHWSRTHFDVTRNVGGFRGARKRQGEVMYANYPIDAGDA